MQELFNYLNRHQPQMLRTLEELVEHETPSNDKSLLDGFAERLAGLCAWLDASVAVIPNASGGNHIRLIIQPPGAAMDTAKHALVLCHFDTVWPKGWIDEHPFTVTDGVASGPGCFDMKSGIVLFLFALRAIHELRLSLPRPIVALLTSDEEIGSPTSRPLIEREARSAAYALVLESPLEGGALKTARKGVGMYRLLVHGRAAHAGLEPEKGINAIVELTRHVQTVTELNAPERGTTLNVGVISGGTRSNVVPARAEAQVDVRVTAMAEAERVDHAFRGLRPVLPGARLEVSGGLNRPPMERSPAIAALFERAREIGRELGMDLGEGAAGGASDGNFTAALGLPTLDGLGALGDGAHADHEQVQLDSLAPRAALLAALLVKL
jgi:glutamate carboxypeptidase